MKNIKLIAADMDHTLLTERGELPPRFDTAIHQLEQFGIHFAIASGRPLYTLQKMFAPILKEIILISDNGGAIYNQGQLLFKSLLPKEQYVKMIQFTKEQTAGVCILCGLDSAYIEKKEQKYLSFFQQFFAKLTFVEDLCTVTTEVNKFTIYFPDKTSKDQYTQLFYPTFSTHYSVTVGDTIWVDITNKGVDKGHAMNILGKQLGITAQQMMAFGDTYNDIELLRAVEYSYLVANADADSKTSDCSKQ